MPLSRRDFTARTVLAGAGVALTGTVGALATAPGALAAEDGTRRDEHGRPCEPGYGPLVADPAGLLALPAGFAYRVITHSGVTKLDSGEITPSNHDGTAAFEGHRGVTLLVNNHELKGKRESWAHPVPLTEGLVYDPAAAAWLHGRRGPARRRGRRVGGRRRYVDQLRGRLHPWDTWLTCEETEDLAYKNGMTKDHGYVFEVDPHDRRANRDPQPIKAFGRYAHEAVVIDPRHGHAYLTEDASGPNGLLYRWTPCAASATGAASSVPSPPTPVCSRPPSASTARAGSSTTSRARRRSAPSTGSTGWTWRTATRGPCRCASSSARAP